MEEEEEEVCVVPLTIRGHKVEVLLSEGVMFEATSPNKVKDRVDMVLHLDLDPEGIMAIIRDRINKVLLECCNKATFRIKVQDLLNNMDRVRGIRMMNNSLKDKVTISKLVAITNINNSNSSTNYIHHHSHTTANSSFNSNLLQHATILKEVMWTLPNMVTKCHIIT